MQERIGNRGKKGAVLTILVTVMGTAGCADPAPSVLPGADGDEVAVATGALAFGTSTTWVAPSCSAGTFRGCRDASSAARCTDFGGPDRTN
jgi:hypothetical protein